MAFPLLVAHLELWTQEQVYHLTPLLHPNRKGVNGGPRGDVTCRWHAATRAGWGGRASPWGRTQVLAGGADLERKDGGDGSPQ